MKFTIFSLIAFSGAVLAAPLENAEASTKVVSAEKAEKAAANPPPPSYGNGYGGYVQPNYAYGGYGGGKPGYGPRGPPPVGFQYYQYPQPGYYQPAPAGYYIQPGYGYGNRWW